MKTPIPNSLPWTVLVATALLLSACGGGGGGAPMAQAHPSVAARTTPLDPNDPDCPYGGILVETGIDENGNGVLDTPDEVDETQKVCNGADGLTALVALTNEAPGANCPAGGQRVDTGLDDDRDGTLDADEIDDSRYVCNGADGMNTLMAVNEEPAGPNCPFGGLRIDSGLDLNGNGALDPDTGEITETGFLCRETDHRIGWQMAEPLTAGTPQDADSPRVAADGSGNILAIWRQRDGDKWSLWSRRYTPGSGWGTAEVIGGEDVRSLDFPRIAADADGNALAVWRQWDGSDYSLWSNRYEAGSGWGTPQRIDDTKDPVYRPSLAMNSQGAAMVVWEQVIDGRSTIRAAHFDPENGWGTPQAVENGDQDAGLAHVAMDPDGNAIVVWVAGSGATASIWANRYQPASDWGTPVAISDPQYAYNPRVALSASGRALAVWEQTGDIMANHFDPDTGWVAPQAIEQNDGEAHNPRLAVDVGTGFYHIVWEQWDGIEWRIWYGSVNYVSGVTSPWNISDRPIQNHLGPARNPRIAMGTPSHTLTAVWQQWDGSRWNIWANRMAVPTDDVHFSWGMEERVETGSLDAQQPDVAVSPAGEAFVVWRQDEGADRAGVWGNRWLSRAP